MWSRSGRSFLRTPAMLVVLASFMGVVQIAAGSAARDRMPEDRQDRLTAELERARESVYPALINISVISQMYSGGRAIRMPSAGSGVIVSPDGYALTNFHVVAHSTRVIGRLATGESFDAEVIALDPLTDLAVLKLDASKREEPLPFAAIGDSDLLNVGDFVLAMGNPLTLSSSMTLGIVSNTRRVFTNFTGTELEDLDLGGGERSGIFTQWIQHDALILPGNSGGPLVNLRGEVIGINALGGSGVGFAIPSSLARVVFDQVLEYGDVPRAWLGTQVLPTEKLDDDEGALVSWVVPGSPAHGAGLRPGDRLLAIDGSPVSVRFFEQVPIFHRTVAEMEIGTTVELDIRRGGEKQTVHATLTEMERYVGDEREFREFGATVRAITGPMALALRLPDTKGVLLTGVRPGHPFEEARPRLSRGDVILSIAGRPTESLDAFQTIASDLAGDESVPVIFLRRQEQLMTVVEPRRTDQARRAGELSKAWLGIQAQVVTTPVAEALGVAGTRGFRVTQVYRGTEADRGGIRVGDLITEIDGIPLEAHRPQDAQELRQLVEESPIGEQVELIVLRDGVRTPISVVLEASPQAATEAERGRQEDFEFSYRTIAFMDGIEQGWPEDAAGLLVTEVTGGGWANIAGLRGNDLIVSVNDVPVPTIAAFEAIMEKSLQERPRVIRLFVYRGHRTSFVFIEPDWRMFDT